ncbi:beta-1,4-galactosyltransferase 1-like, partial [Paramuricea clavata]
MAAFILSERILARSFVAMTFLLIGAMLLYVAQESAETLKPIAIIVLDPNFKESPFASTGNVISTKSKESQTTSAESQPQRQNSNVPPGHGKSTVLNSGNIRRLNGTNASTAKNNAQIDMNAKNSTAAIVKYAKPLQSNSQQSNSHMIQPTNRQNVSQAQNKSATQLPLCKKPNEDLVGRLQVNQSVPDMEDIASSWNERNWVLNGGAWRPITCQAVSKVAIIIPYRDRYPHLKIFLRHMHPILKRQLLDYRIIVVEQ